MLVLKIIDASITPGVIQRAAGAVCEEKHQSQVLVFNFYQIFRWVARRILGLLLGKECWAVRYKVSESSHPFSYISFLQTGGVRIYILVISAGDTAC